MKSKKKVEKEEVKVKKTKTFDLRLTKTELVHLRDMLSILYPTTDEKTISEALAASEQRTFEESALWKKVAAACVEAEIPVDDEAPDYAIVPIGHAPMGVFMLGQDEEQQARLAFMKEKSEEDSDSAPEED